MSRILKQRSASFVSEATARKDGSKGGLSLAARRSQGAVLSVLLELLGGVRDDHDESDSRDGPVTSRFPLNCTRSLRQAMGKGVVLTRATNRFLSSRKNNPTEIKVITQENW